MPNQRKMIVLRTLAAGVSAVSLLACTQQPQTRQSQGAAAPGASQSSGATSGMPMSQNPQQMRERCDQMMREGHGNMPMSPEMQKMMEDCNRMQMQGNQPPR